MVFSKAPAFMYAGALHFPFNHFQFNAMFVLLVKPCVSQASSLCGPCVKHVFLALNTQH